MSVPSDDIAALLTRADEGDIEAKGALFSALYDDLHRLAQAHVRRSAGSLTLGATTLLHEAYLDISKRGETAFPDRNRFLGYASRAMRGLVINYVRDRAVQKRGGDLTFVALDEERDAGAARADELEALGAALDELAQMQPDLAELVDLKFFCRFSFVEIAAMRTVTSGAHRSSWRASRSTSPTGPSLGSSLSGFAPRS